MRITAFQSIRLINITIMGLWTSIILSYFSAVIGGEIPLFYKDGEIYWPMISDTWVTLNGELLSRICIPPFIYTWAIFCWSVCDWLDKMSWGYYGSDDLLDYIQYNKPKITRRINKYINYTNRYIVLVGLLSFLICIAINEDDNDKLHSLTALTFFITQLLFSINVVVHLYIFNGNVYNKTSLLLKTILIILLSLCLAITGILCSFNNWGMYKNYIAGLEWLSVIFVSMFHWSLKWEFSSLLNLDLNLEHNLDLNLEHNLDIDLDIYDALL